MNNKEMESISSMWPARTNNECRMPNAQERCGFMVEKNGVNSRGRLLGLVQGRAGYELQMRPPARRRPPFEKDTPPLS